MKIQISTTEAARNLGDCIARIRYAGAHFVLLKNNKPVAELGPVGGERPATLRSLWDSLKGIESDPDFAADLERVNRTDRPMDNPWDS